MKRPPRRAAGFTLVEVVIALTLIAMLMAGLVAALATFGRTSSSLEARFEKSDEQRLVSEFLRSTLGRTAENYRLRLPGESEQAMFVGAPSEIQWLGVMPARYGMGGLHHFRLVAGASGTSLMLQYQPYIGGGSMPDWGNAPVRELVHSLRGFSAAYAGEEEEQWFPHWEGQQESPRLVRLSIATERGVWPELVVRPRSAGGSRRTVVTVGAGR